MTAKEWRDKNLKIKGNIRDYSDVYQLVILANLENLNAEYIKDGLLQKERLLKLNESAIAQMKSLLGNINIKKLESGLFILGNVSQIRTQRWILCRGN